MSAEAESGLLVNGPAPKGQDSLNGSSPELRANTFSEPAASPRERMSTAENESPSDDALLVVLLRGVAVAAVFLMPLVAVVLFFDQSIMTSYESRSRLAVFAGSWAVLAMWIILDRGLVCLLEKTQESPAIGWLVLGLGNLAAALGTLAHLMSPSR